MSKALDISGQRYGKLVAIRRTKRDISGQAHWLFRCDCGRIHEAYLSNVRKGATKSCGCIVKTHGMWKNNTYYSWAHMKERCNNPGHHAYKDYGGRGIKVCERWNKFKNFLADMGVRPKDLTIERIDNDQGYFPKNCKWATMAEQNKNRQGTIKIEYEGQIKCVSEWARVKKIPKATLNARLKKYPPEIAFGMWRQRGNCSPGGDG